MNELSRALELYLGLPEASWPQSQPEAVARVFGRGTADEISRLLQEIGSIEIDWTAHSLCSGTDYAEAEMKRRHPHLTDEIVANLGWAFSYWNK